MVKYKKINIINNFKGNTRKEYQKLALSDFSKNLINGILKSKTEKFRLSNENTFFLNDNNPKKFEPKIILPISKILLCNQNIFFSR